MSHSLKLEYVGEYKQLKVAGRRYLHVPVQGFAGLARLPFSLRVLLENLMRQNFPHLQNEQWGEIYLPDSGGRKLPLGTYFRFNN